MATNQAEQKNSSNKTNMNSDEAFHALADELKGSFREVVDLARKAAESRVDELKQSKDVTFEGIEEAVREEPIKSLCIASAAGLLLGLYLSR